MVRDLVEVAIRLVKDERFREVQDKATSAAVDKIAELLLKNKDALPEGIAKETVKDEILSHNLDHLTVEIDVREAPKSIDVGMGGGEINIGNIFGDMMPKRYKKRKLAVRDAMKILVDEEADKLIDSENVNTEAIRRAENDGIIFIDERRRQSQRSRRVERGRSEGYSSDCRGMHRQHQIRKHKNGLYFVCRKRSLSYKQRQRPHTRIAGAFPRCGRA